MKQNCWEFFKCGRQPDGDKVEELGICPVACETKLDTVHCGINAGRTCWVVAGSYCDGEIQGRFVSKVKKCMSCEFYKKVFKEEGRNFTLPLDLLKKLKP